MDRRGFLSGLVGLSGLAVAVGAQWTESIVGPCYRLRVRLPDGRQNTFLVWAPTPEALTPSEIERARVMAREELLAWVRRVG